MEIDSFYKAARIGVRTPEKVRGIEWIGLFTSDQGQSRVGSPPHEGAADIDGVVIVSSGVSRVSGIAVTVVTGHQLYTTKKVTGQFKIEVQTKAETPAIAGHVGILAFEGR